MRKITLLVLLTSLFFTKLIAQDPVTYEQAFPNLNFEYPVEIQNANDDSDRLFVVEQRGRIKVFQNNQSTSSQQTFLDMRSVVSFSAGQEIGLLGLAFHPNYKQNGYFYVYHTKTSSVANVSVEIVLARYQVSSSNPNQANASSRLEIFSFDKNQGNSNHNGGKIGFGPDGYLYISVGDGGGGGDPQKNAQNLNNIFGSILRIDVDVNGNNPIESNPDAPNGNYEIPSDNPRRGQSGLDELYAWGIRNTWKFSWDGSRMWGADVGQANLEEINIIEKGGNYGWNRFEGNSNYNTSTGLVTNPDIKPVFTYGHSAGDVSITGGYVYKGSSTNTDIKDKYIYADYVSGRVWALSYNASNNSATSKLLFRTSGEFVSSFGLDEAGELYFSGYGTSAKIFKINGGSETPPPPPGPTTVAVDGVGVWKELENGTNGNVEAIAVNGDNVYVAGSFSTAGGIGANNIAVYNNNTGWSALSSGANGTIKALAVATDGKLYAGGSFTSIGGVSAQNVAVWNGNSWSALGSGTNGAVAKIGIDGNNNVYVGGAFEVAGGITVSNIARWNNGWSALVDSGTSGRGTNNEIRAIAFDSNNTLYVGGNFDNAGGKTANRIATWNGSTWGTLGQGTSGFVQAIEVTNNYIYAGGNFSLADGKTVNRIARWNRSSSQWEALGNGLSGNVNSLAFDGSYLYAGGSFETAGKDASTNYIVKNMARWSSGSGWQAMGPAKNVGTNNVVNDIVLSDDEDRLYTGGTFSTAANAGASRLAVWAQSFDCSDELLITEYRINGEWSSGEREITLEEGTALVLSLLPNSVQFSITLPNGSVVNNDYSLGQITAEDSGVYVYRTQDGCETTLTLTVGDGTVECNEDSVIPEFKIGSGDWVRGEQQITVDEGTVLALSMYPDNKQFTIKLPDGSEVSNDLNLGAVTPAQAGVYEFTSEDGCSASFTVIVIEDEEVCPEGSIVPEYTINNAVYTGAGSVTVDTGDDLVLGSVADDPGLTIRLPNGSEVGDNYQLGNITTALSGVYTFISSAGCEATLTINVNDTIEEPTCDIETEYNVNGVAWIQGESTVTVDEGDAIVLSIIPNGVSFTITAPNGQVSTNDLSLGNITPAQAGVYTFAISEECETTLTIIVNADEPPNCEIIPEYRLNRVWYSGETNLTVSEGTDVMLSILPNNTALTIKLPNGEIVDDNYSLGLVTPEDNGVYIFTTPDGCTASLTLTVEVAECGGILIPEYRINGQWASGENSVVINEGADVAISMLPNGIGLNITLPDGTVVNDNYRLPNFTSAQNGVYILTSEEGCTETLELRMAEDDTNCSDNVITEYRIDGKWFSGENNVSVDEGTNVMLSMLPNDIAMTITKPDGTVVGDNFGLGSVMPEDSGIYTLRSADGCTNTINLEVRNLPNCSENSIIAEYRVNGVWESGQNFVQLEVGTDFIMSALPNTLTVSITLPDGQEVGDNHYLGALTLEDSGFYILTSSQGCKTVIELVVVENGGGRNGGFDQFGVDFENPERATDLITAYPNPTTDIVNIDLYSLKGQKVDVVVTNTQQQQMVFKALKEDHPVDLELSLGNYSAGTYFISLWIDGEVITKKVVKR